MNRMIKLMLAVAMSCGMGAVANASFIQDGIEYSDDGTVVLNHIKGMQAGTVNILPSVLLVDVAALASHYSSELEPVYNKDTRIEKMVFSSPELTVEYRGLFDSYINEIDFRDVGQLYLTVHAIEDTHAKKLHLPENTVFTGGGIFLDCADWLTDIYWHTTKSQREAIGYNRMVYDETYSFFQWDAGSSAIRRRLHVRCDAGLWDAQIPILENGKQVGTIDVIRDIGLRLDDSYGPFVPGEKMELLIPDLVGYTAKGLPYGLMFSATTGKISGVPTIPTGDAGVGVTFSKKYFETLSTAFIVGPFPQLAVGIVGEGKVTGAGGYAANKKVILRATGQAAKIATITTPAVVATVFAGWFADETCETSVESTVDYRTPSLSYVMPAEDVTLYAKFIPASEDTDIWLVADDGTGAWDVSTNAAETVFNTSGALELALWAESYSLPKITVSGLPTGLRFTAKPVYVMGSKTEVAHAANTIYGTATKPGTYVVTVKLTNATVKKPIERKFTIVVDNFTGANGLLAVSNGEGQPPDYFNARGEKYVVSVGVVEFNLPHLLALNGLDRVTLTGLPSGLRYNATTGAIEGVATRAGTFTVWVRVGIAVSTFTIQVEALPSWAVGKFVGFGMQLFDEDDGGASLSSDSGVLFTLVISPTGKCSCKGTTDFYTLSLRNFKQLVRAPNGQLCVMAEGVIVPGCEDSYIQAEFWLSPIALGTNGAVVGRADLLWFNTKMEQYGVWVDTPWADEPMILTEEGFPLLKSAWASQTAGLPSNIEGKEELLVAPDGQGVTLRFGTKDAVTAALWDGPSATSASATASGQLSLYEYDSERGIWKGQICLIFMPPKGDEIGAIVTVEIDGNGEISCEIVHFERNWR